MLGYLQGITLCSTKFRFFFDILVRFLSEIAAKISQSQVMFALQNYTTNVTFSGLHDGAIRLRLLLLGEISTSAGSTTTEFPKCREINAFSATSRQLVVGITRGFLRLQRYDRY